jgi:hypothetical protein
VNPNPLLEEIWRIKDQLAREADYDLDRFCENLRAWSKTHPHSGPVVRNAEELTTPPTSRNAADLAHRRDGSGKLPHTGSGLLTTLTFEESHRMLQA